MSDFITTFKALMDAKGGAGHQFQSKHNPAAKYGLQKPARDITLWGAPAAVQTDNTFLNILNPNAFRPNAVTRPPPAAPSVGSLLGKGGSTKP